MLYYGNAMEMFRVNGGLKVGQTRDKVGTKLGESWEKVGTNQENWRKSVR